MIAIMPLIVMCGYPCSGKTRRAEELKVYFEEKCDRKVYVVGDGTVDVERNAVYAGEFNRSVSDCWTRLKWEVNVMRKY